MKTRAKFECTAVTKRKGWNRSIGEFVYDAEFMAVTANSSEPQDENNLFFASTPSGQIKILTVRSDHFQPGQVYYVDFTPAGT